MTQETEPTIEAIISDLRTSHAATTQGTWTKGKTSHETVSKQTQDKPYRVAEFRHADDAQFCDLAHAFVPRLIAELERLRAPVAPVPQGWKLVPEWPTVQMSIAGDEVYRQDGPDVFSSNAIYTRMLAAAPQPPEVGHDN